MLPADIVGTYVETLPMFREYNGNDPAVRSMIVAYSTNILINVLTAMVCLRLLTLLGFTKATDRGWRTGAAGVYNPSALHAEHDGEQLHRAAHFGRVCLSVRVADYWRTSGTGDRVGGVRPQFAYALDDRDGPDRGRVFLLLVFGWKKVAAEIGKRFRAYAATALPIYAVFVLVDRLYQYYRFGSFFNTYVSVFAQQAREMNPSLPAKYPFEVPFHVGFFGALFAPEKSIFLFDPLLILTVLVAASVGRVWGRD